jgi:hypothetical protein
MDDEISQVAEQRPPIVMKSASVPSARGRVAEQPIGGRM